MNDPIRLSLWRVLCGVALGALLVTLNACERGSEPEAARLPQRGEALIRDADARLERARRVEVVGVHARTTLERGDTARDWRVVEFDAYPADWDFVVFATRGLAMARVLEARTAREDRHAMLGLVDPREITPSPGVPPAAEGAGMLIRWLDDRGEELAAVVLGDHADDSGIRRSARLAGAAQSWLIEGQTPISAEPTTFINAMLSTMPRGRIGRVRVSRGDWSIEIGRESWQEEARLLEPTPPARLVDGVGERLLDAMAFLPMREARRAGDAPVGGDPVVTVIYRLFEGARVTLRLFGPEGSEGPVWATVRAEPAAVIGNDEFPNPDRLEAWLEREGLRWHGWAFRVPREAVALFLSERDAFVRD